MWRKEEKLAYLADNVDWDGKHNSLNTVEWEQLAPNEKNTWLVSEHYDEYADLIPVGTKEAKSSTSSNPEVIFRTYSLGIATNRDNLAYSFAIGELEQQAGTFTEIYNATVDKYKRLHRTAEIEEVIDTEDERIKWTRQVKRSLTNLEYSDFDTANLRSAIYRPFTKKHVYFSNFWNEERYQQHIIFPTPVTENENLAIALTSIGSEKPFVALITNIIPDLHLTSPGTGAQCFPFYVYDEDGGNRRENITDWALGVFRERYSDPSPCSPPQRIAGGRTVFNIKVGKRGRRTGQQRFCGHRHGSYV